MLSSNRFKKLTKHHAACDSIVRAFAAAADGKNAFWQ